MAKEVWEAIGFFFLIMAILFGLWLFNGGPQRAASEQGAFIQPISPGSKAVIYGPTSTLPQTTATTTINIPGLK